MVQFSQRTTFHNNTIEFQPRKPFHHSWLSPAIKLASKMRRLAYRRSLMKIPTNRRTLRTGSAVLNGIYQKIYLKSTTMLLKYDRYQCFQSLESLHMKSQSVSLDQKMVLHLLFYSDAQYCPL